MAKYPRIKSSEVLLRDSYDNISGVVDNGGTLNGGASISGGNLVCVGNGGASYPGYFYDLWDNGFTIVLGLATTTSVPDTTYRRFFAYRIDANHTILMAIRRSDGGTVVQINNAAGSNYYTIISALDLDAAQVVTLTWDGTTLSLYKNTGLLGSIAVAGGGVISVPATEFTVRVGEGPTSSFAGNISFVTILAQAATAAEVADVSNQTTYREIDESKALVSLPLRSHYNDGTDQVTENIGNLGGTVQLGDGSTAGTFPTQLTPHGMSFDGGDYIQGASQSIADGNVTAIAWIKTSTSTGAVIDNFESASPFTGFGFELDPAGSGVLAFYAADGVASTFTLDSSGLAVDDGVLRHVAVTYTGTTVTFYINGELSSEVARSHTLGESTGPIRIGATTNSPINRYFNGEIYTPKIFNATFTPTQVREIHRRDLKLINL
jgi:hypothetical protein